MVNGGFDLSIASPGLHYVVGDATAPYGADVRFIAHVCNDEGGWGRGFVTALSRRSTTPELSYRSWHKDGIWENAPFELGQIQVTGFDRPGVLVVNMIAQHGIRHDPKAPPAIDYKALRGCFTQLGDEVTRWNESCGIVPTIHMPRIGCGLGGGDWAVVEEAVLAHLVDIYGLSVTVYDLPGTQPGN